MGHVYQICRGRKKTADLGCLRLNGALSVTWHDCANVLLRNFFPVAEKTAREDIPPGAPPILEALEIQKVVAYKKFFEAGLEVKQKSCLKARVCSHWRRSLTLASIG